MQTYSTFAPTGFDRRGAFLHTGDDDRQDWLVAPCGINRDSDSLEASNWHVMLAVLGGESDDCETHRFGHWACGWFEIVLVRPGSEAARKAQECEDALADYPVLDDDDCSAREWDDRCECADFNWKVARMRERIAECAKAGVSIFAARRDERPSYCFMED